MVLVVDDEYLPRETNERLKETDAINWKMGINAINDHVFFNFSIRIRSNI